jgi:hypothetical protein
MPTTDDQTDPTTEVEPGAEADRRAGRSGLVGQARRYGPFVVVAVLVAVAVVVFRGGGSDEDEASVGEATTDREELIRSGPMTPEKAELLGEGGVDFGPGCDLDTGRIMLPTAYAPPCVEPFEGDNGGSTSKGVTADTIKVVAYMSDSTVDPLGAALFGAAGDPEDAIETVEKLAEVYNATFETYGREVELEVFWGTGPMDDQELAKADGIAVAEKEPFAVIGGPAAAAGPFSDELASRDILCLQGCSSAMGTAWVEDHAPYIWTGGIGTVDGGRVTGEAVGKLAGPGKADMAGDAEMRQRDRVYGVLYADYEGGEEVLDGVREGLAEHDAEVTAPIAVNGDPARAQEVGRTVISQLKEAGVTTVIYSGGPLEPGWLTSEATAQDYHPEWILGPNAFADTALFSRGYDQDQWTNGFGVAFGPTVSQRAGEAGHVYEWAYGEDPPSPVSGVLELPLRTLFTGVHMAGPDLTVESFRDGLFRYPRSGDGLDAASVSWGDHGIWPGIDYGDSDDVGIMWWDPEAEGEPGTNAEGVGLYRLANGGQRYLPGEIPGSLDEAGLFDVESSVPMYSLDSPEEDLMERYPPPPPP